MKLTCEWCQKRAAERYCADCDAWYCADCAAEGCPLCGAEPTEVDASGEEVTWRCAVCGALDEIGRCATCGRTLCARCDADHACCSCEPQPGNCVDPLTAGPVPQTQPCEGDDVDWDGVALGESR